jgi:2'-5' RNA ligase
MENKRFLTVMAVLDSDTQGRMEEIQKRIIQSVGEGTQTMGIPFHITLGSYATSKLEAVISVIKRVAADTKPFEIELSGLGSFGDRVLFIKPDISHELLHLRSFFENDYANGYEWVPHATLFCGEDKQVRAARELVSSIYLPESAKIVGIELGEFFPANKKFSMMF